MCCSPWHCKEADTTEQLNNVIMEVKFIILLCILYENKDIFLTINEIQKLETGASVCIETKLKILNA